MKTPICIFGAMLALACVCWSCQQTTEQYAQKENGLRFDNWKLNYNADDQDIYWPIVKLDEPIEGDLMMINLNYNWLTEKVTSRDTTWNTAHLDVSIRTDKSKNDAQYYNTVILYAGNQDNQYWPLLEYRFLFNEGQADSLSLDMMPEGGAFVASKEQSEKIVSLFEGSKPVHLNVSIDGITFNAEYSFIIPNSSKLTKCLDLAKKRQILAETERKKL